MQNSFRQYNSQGFRIDKTFFFSFFFLPIRSGFFIFFFFFFTKQFFLTIWLKITNAFKSKQNMLFLKLCFTYNSASYVINYIGEKREKNSRSGEQTYGRGKFVID